MPERPTYDALLQKVKDLEKEAVSFKAVEKAFRESERKYRLLVKNLPCVIYKGYADWSVEFFDSKIHRITGYNTDEFDSGKIKWNHVIVNEDIERAKQVFIEALKTDRSFIREYRIKSKIGDILWIQERGQIICNNKGRIEYVSGVFFDITDHEQAHDRLRESEEKARALLNATTDAVVLIDSQGIILDINDTYAHRFQKTVDEMLGLCIWHLAPHEVTGPLVKHVKDVFESGKPLRMVDERFGRWHDSNIYPVCNSWGTVTRAAIFSRDITDLKHAEEHIRILSQQLIKAQENERQRIACDLHDNVAQDLSLLKISWETLFDNSSSPCGEIRQKTSELSKILQRCILYVRDMAYDLQPPGLDQLGLAPTIYQYCEEFSKKNGINIDFFAAGLDHLNISSDTEINLYRIIQEALWNIKKHADAENITIKLVASFPYIILRIEDDGIGFDIKTQFAEALKKKRMGLRSMEERVCLLNGKMDIKSRPNEGTKIVIEVPFKEDTCG